ncbi:hypothetical protein PFISCL1PPCAC_21152 [Pristionchus fissidentatus]|uniref:Galectin n=1 Tax=Pristionchus fissidentatus TaxID=1538716 RepID=A0AAV5WDU9_9BILA|nr:hypothetical protein PFISCL1PPCAC_21152 [Pristionchus fissidentatus]
MEQRFTLPSLPLHRELQAPVTIGTQFSVRATPIEVDKHTVSITLVTASSEAALEISLHLPDKHGREAKLRAVSRSATSETAPMEKEVSAIAPNKEFILGVIVKEHVFEIYLDTIFLLAFVHRVNPSEIRRLVLDGAMICNEVVIVPVKTDMPRLPEYNEVSLNARPPPQQQQPRQPAAPPAPRPTSVPLAPRELAPRQGPPVDAAQRPPIGAGAGSMGALVPTTSAIPLAPVAAPTPWWRIDLLDEGSYEAITRKLLQWKETVDIDVQNKVAKMTADPFKKPRK